MGDATRSYTMETHRIWIVTTVDGKVASVASDYSGLLRTALILSGRKENGSKSAKARAAMKMAGEYGEVKTVRMGSAELLSFSASLRPEDLQLFGTDFQKEIWMKLFSLNHDGSAPKLYSYSDFARLCGRQSAVRAVAHAVAMNPLPVIVPCHRIVPKEAIDRIAEIEKAASKTIFKGSDVWLFDSIDFGEYSLGSELKRELLAGEFSYGIPEE